MENTAKRIGVGELGRPAVTALALLALTGFSSSAACAMATAIAVFGLLVAC